MALMPLVHQDSSRGGGGSKEKRRSLGDYYGRVLESTPPSANGTSNNFPLSDWRWAEPMSPEAAQTPQSMVPANCFPSRNSQAYASYSENARPGGGRREDTGITDLIASLKALAMPTQSNAPGVQTAAIQLHLSYDGADKRKLYPTEPWAETRAPPPPVMRELRQRRSMPRRASFSGGVGTGSRVTAQQWRGTLPPRCTDTAGGFSPKVFLGGLPWDFNEICLLHALEQFQPIRFEWPGRDDGEESPRGFAYVTLESERRVRALLAAARHVGNEWYYTIHSPLLIRPKEVQVIPWALADSSWVLGNSVKLDSERTVFVGALHGMISAPALAFIMNDLFGGVVYAGIDTDKNKYPIGSGRVTFDNVRSYLCAVSAAFVEIRTDKFVKKVQVDPYLEDSMCSVCNLHQGPYFCREPICFRYYCRSCWSRQHVSKNHTPLTRKSRGAPPLPPPPPPAPPAISGPPAPPAPSAPTAPTAGAARAAYLGPVPPSSPEPSASTASSKSPHEHADIYYNGAVGGLNGDGTPSASTSGLSSGASASSSLCANAAAVDEELVDWTR